MGLALVGVLLLTVYLRLTGLDWDGLNHLHPDERYIVWVGTTIEVPPNWESAFDPELSTFNPFRWPPEAESAGIGVYQGEPRAFAYGHWPLYLGVATAHLLDGAAAKVGDGGIRLPDGWTLARDLLNVPGRIEYRHLLLVGRTLAALFDTVTVMLVFLLGRRLYGPAAGLLAAAFVALAVLHIQQARFFVSDPFLTTAVVAAVYWMVRRVESERWRDAVVAGALVGLAAGAKFSAIMLVLPLAVALMWRRQKSPVARGAVLRRRLLGWWHGHRRPVVELTLALLAGVVIFAVTNPFALLDNTCEGSIGGFSIPLVSLRIKSIATQSCYLKNIGTQAAMVRGSDRIPFTLQYIGTLPYLYYLDQMFRWGLGAPLALVSLGGLLWGIARVWRRRPRFKPGEAVLLAWVLPFLAVTGGFQVKFLRYLLPLTPFLAIYGAGMLSGGWGKGRRAVSRRPLVRILGHAGWAGTLLFTALWAAAFVGLYRVDDHPWVAASHWIYQNVPDGSVLATEHWDHALPLKLRDQDGQPISKRYRPVTLEWYDVEDRLGRESSRVELDDAVQRVASSDYLVLASNRLYGVIPRLPERFPEGAAYYRLLFSGALGFELVHWDSRYPSLGPVTVFDDSFVWPALSPPSVLLEGWPAAGRWVLNWGPADESFTAYDHPLVLIFENRDRLSAEEMEVLIRAEAGVDDRETDAAPDP